MVDKQLGCAGLLMAMTALDPTITFTGARITPFPRVPTEKPPSRHPSPIPPGARLACSLPTSSTRSFCRKS